MKMKMSPVNNKYLLKLVLFICTISTLIMLQQYIKSISSFWQDTSYSYSNNNNNNARSLLLLSSSSNPPYTNNNDQNRHNINNNDNNDQKHHNIQFVLNPLDACSSADEIDVILAVPISRNNFAGRRTIKETWGSFDYARGSKGVLLFFIGNASATENPDVEARIQEEYGKYRDIVQADFVDSYQNLTMKSVSILKWVTTYCSKAKYLIKADDDIYLNVPLLMTHFQQIVTTQNKTSPNFVLGKLVTGAVPIRDSNDKWHASFKDFPEKKYPNYVSGTCYSMPLNTAHLLYRAALQLKWFWLEDIFITGICAKKMNIPVLNNPYQTYEKPKPSGCVYKYQVHGHRYSLAQIKHIHKELYDTTIKCPEKKS